MQASDYQESCTRTWAESEDWRIDLLYLATKLVCEASEVAQLIVKQVKHGKQISLEELAEELGDTEWYSAMIATAYGLDLDTILQDNLTKLAKRHKTGDPTIWYQEPTHERE